MKPFSKTSKAGSGWAMIFTFMLIEFAKMVDFPLTEAEATAVVQSVLVFGGLALAVYGQLTREDLDFGLFRKEPK